MTTQTLSTVYHGQVPAPVVEALERFDESAENARSLSTMRLAHVVAEDLNKLVERDTHLGEALRLALKALPNSTDDDEVRALLTMALEYNLETANRFFRLAGRVLEGFNRLAPDAVAPNH